MPLFFKTDITQVAELTLHTLARCTYAPLREFCHYHYAAADAIAVAPAATVTRYAATGYAIQRC